MSLFYTVNGEIFVPEQINPDIAKVAKIIVKAQHLTFKCQMRTNSLQNSIKSGKKELMLDTMLKCIEKNADAYNRDMSLSGVSIAQADDGFFADKDEEFLKNQLEILSDFAVINTVIDARLMALLSAAVEKSVGTPINRLKFFTNQPNEPIEEPDENED